MTPVRRTLVLGFLAAIAAAASLSAQPFDSLRSLTAQQPRPTFRTSVDVVRLDVTVLDKNRRPVRDLKRDDFTILVDGVEQPIVAFDPVVLPAVDRAAAPWTRETAGDVRSNDVHEPRLFILVMDDVSTPPDMWMARTGREAAHAIVDEMLPSDLASVVFTFSSKNNQELTSDRTALRRAIDTFKPQCCLHPIVAVRMVQSTLKNVFTVVREREMPGRSALMWLSPGPPKLGSNSFGQDAGLLREMDSPFELITWANEVGAEARVSNLPVYGFSIAGLVAPGPGAGAPSSPIFADISTQFTAGDADLGNELMRSVSNATGGRSIVNTNAVARFVPGIVNELNAYYAVGYRATYPMNDRKSRRLRIRVNRPDLTVFPNDRTLLPPAKPNRRAEAPPKDPTLRMLDSAMSDVLPKRDIPLRISLAPFAPAPGVAGAKNTAAVAMTLGIEPPAPEEPRTEHLKMLTRVFKPNGDLVTSASETADVTWDSGAVLHDVRAKLALKPGRYIVRTSVHSAARHKTGSVYTDVVVPDFQKERVALSGVLLNVHGAPTTERTFSAGQRVEAIVRVYQSAKRPPPAVHVRASITNDAGVDVFTHTATVTPPLEGLVRSQDFRVTVPDTLAPGAYLLTLTATAGEKDVRRADVRFTVRR